MPGIQHLLPAVLIVVTRAVSLDPQLDANSLMKMIDKDGDGLVSEKEILNLMDETLEVDQGFEALAHQWQHDFEPKLARHFAQVDAKRQGKIDVEQLDTLIKLFQENHFVASSLASELPDAASVMKLLDADGDGWVSETDVFDGAAAYSAADAGFEAVADQWKSEFKAKLAGFFAQVDSTRSGKINLDGLEALMKFLQDENLDASLSEQRSQDTPFVIDNDRASLSESGYQDAASLMKLLDRDGDGFVSEAEIFEGASSDSAAEGGFAEVAEQWKSEFKAKLASNFAQADMTRSGKLDFGGLEALLKLLQDDGVGHSSTESHIRTGGSGKDDDMSLSTSQFPDAASVMQLLDKDGDGFVSEKDILDGAAASMEVEEGLEALADQWSNDFETKLLRYFPQVDTTRSGKIDLDGLTALINLLQEQDS